MEILGSKLYILYFFSRLKKVFFKKEKRKKVGHSRIHTHMIWIMPDIW